MPSSPSPVSFVGPYVGTNLAAARLDVAVHGPDPAPLSWAVANDELRIATLVDQLSPFAPTRIVLEAMGGLELPVVARGCYGLHSRPSTGRALGSMSMTKAIR